MPLQYLAQLADGIPLSESQAESLFDLMVAGELSDPQIASVLSLLRVRPFTVDELVGAARSMRRHVTPIPGAAEIPGTLIDTCGTGGTAKTLNVSSIAAFAVAGTALDPNRCGVSRRVLVAKHGNRSRSGRGSAEVLAGLGVNIEAPPHIQAQCLNEANICFCFAIHYHPAGRNARTARQAIGFVTIFNAVGPLTNPAGAKRQLLGVYSTDLLPKAAAALARLGCERAMVVHSELATNTGSSMALDEISTGGDSLIADVIGTTNTLRTFNASTLGIAPAKAELLTPRDLPHAVDWARAILGLPTQHPISAEELRAGLDIVALNAGAALFVADAVPSIDAGLAAARESLGSGLAAQSLERLISISNRR